MPMDVVSFKLMLISNLKSTGRLVEAEIEARQAIEQTVAFGAKGTCHSATAVFPGKTLRKLASGP